MQIRAGLHVGDLMSGVVGLRMPQFTVFGDTVNSPPPRTPVCRRTVLLDSLRGGWHWRASESYGSPVVPPHTAEHGTLLSKANLRHEI